MDLKQFMIGVLIAALVISVFGLVIAGLTSNYGTDTTDIGTSLNPLLAQSNSTAATMNKTASDMSNLFTNTQPSLLGSLNDLYTAAGGTARLAIDSIGLVFGMLVTSISQYSWASYLIIYALTALVLTIIISIAYLVLFGKR